MSRKLIALPNKNLRKQSKLVNYIDDKIKDIINQMEQITLDWEDSREHEVGVALAAVQIDVHKRIIIIRNNFDNKQDRSFKVYINPEIVSRGEEIVEDFEGCLSIKDVYGKVPRYNKITVKAKDINNNVVKITATDFLARVFQHEIDHTNGVLFVDKIKDNPDAFYKLSEDGKIKSLDNEEKSQFDSILW